MACEVWSKCWSGKHLLFHCDNQAIVQVWGTGLRSSSLMRLVRALFFVAARCNFHVLIAHAHTWH